MAGDLASASKLELGKHEIINPLGLEVPGAAGHSQAPTAHGAVDNGHAPDAHGVDSHAKDAHVATVSHAAPVEVSHASMVPIKEAVSNPIVLDRITAVNSKMVKVQRRIDEVNERVKGIQTQYKALMQSVKTVEKQMVMAQIAKSVEAEKSKAETSTNRYQYKAPDGMFYDQSVTDSYP